MTTLNPHEILERAGADPNAPEGSQAWALAQVGAAHDRWKELASEAVYVGLCIGHDCASMLATLQERGVYKPSCDDGLPSNANARRDADKIADIYRRGLIQLRESKS